MSSSDQPTVSDGGKRKRGPGSRRKFSDEQKRAYVEGFKGDMLIRDYCAQVGITTTNMARWRKEFKASKRRKSKNNTPDHERDITALALLNNGGNGAGHVVLPTAEYPHAPSNNHNQEVDERLGVVLGATIAEIMKRLRR